MAKKKKKLRDNMVSCVLVAKDCVSKARFKKALCELFMVKDVAVVCLKMNKHHSLTAAIRIPKEVYEGFFYPARLLRKKKGWIQRVEARVPKRLEKIVASVGLGPSSRCG